MASRRDFLVVYVCCEPARSERAWMLNLAGTQGD